MGGALLGSVHRPPIGFSAMLVGVAMVKGPTRVLLGPALLSLTGRRAGFDYTGRGDRQTRQKGVVAGGGKQHHALPPFGY